MFKKKKSTGLFDWWYNYFMGKAENEEAGYCQVSTREQPQQSRISKFFKKDPVNPEEILEKAYLQIKFQDDGTVDPDSISDFVAEISEDERLKKGHGFSSSPRKRDKIKEDKKARIAAAEEYKRLLAERIKEKGADEKTKAALSEIGALTFTEPYIYYIDNDACAEYAVNNKIFEPLESKGINTEYLVEHHLKETANWVVDTNSRSQAYLDAFVDVAENQGFHYNPEDLERHAAEQAMDNAVEQWIQKMPEYKEKFDNPGNYSSQELTDALAEAIVLADSSNWNSLPDQKEIIRFYIDQKECLDSINDYQKYPVEGAGDPDVTGVETPYILDIARTYNLDKNQIENIYKKIIF